MGFKVNLNAKSTPTKESDRVKEREEEEMKKRKKNGRERKGREKRKKSVPVERPGNAVRAAIAVAHRSWLWAVVGCNPVLSIIHSRSCHTTWGCNTEQQHQNLKWGKERKNNIAFPWMLLRLCIWKGFTVPSITLIFPLPDLHFSLLLPPMTSSLGSTT